MNRNQGQGNPAAPFPLAGNRFSRPWLSTRNPLQQVMPGASQMSTGGSYGTAARARGGLPINRPVGGPSSQQAPAAALAGHPPFPFLAPWSQTQPSQPEYDHHQGFQNASGADASQPAGYGAGGNGFLEPQSQPQYVPHSQPSHTAARLLEELQGRSAPTPTPIHAKKEDPLPLLKEILEKLEYIEKNQETLQKSVESMELKVQAQANSFEPAVESMHQAIAFIKDAASKQQKVLADMAVQTSPFRQKVLSLPRASHRSTPIARQQIRPIQVVPAQHVRAAAAVQPTQLFSALAAEPTVGGKRPRYNSEEEENEDEEDDVEDEVSSRLARRVQRHRRMMAKSKAFASEK